jgi:hypothetical protein
MSRVKGTLSAVYSILGVEVAYLKDEITYLGVDKGCLRNLGNAYLFLPLVWPHGIIGHLGETFGSFTASTAPTLEFLFTKSRL